MIKTLTTEIDIAATPQRVWQVLSDLSAYPEWNPFIVQATGRAVVGDRLTLRMQPVVGRERTLRPTVTEAREGERLRWVGRLGIRGILDVEHSFLLEPARGSHTRLVQREDFRGLLILLPLQGHARRIGHLAPQRKERGNATDAARLESSNGSLESARVDGAVELLDLRMRDAARPHAGDELLFPTIAHEDERIAHARRLRGGVHVPALGAEATRIRASASRQRERGRQHAARAQRAQRQTVDRSATGTRREQRW